MKFAPFTGISCGGEVMLLWQLSLTHVKLLATCIKLAVHRRVTMHQHWRNELYFLIERNAQLLKSDRRTPTDHPSCYLAHASPRDFIYWVAPPQDLAGILEVTENIPSEKDNLASAVSSGKSALSSEEVQKEAFFF